MASTVRKARGKNSPPHGQRKQEHRRRRPSKHSPRRMLRPAPLLGQIERIVGALLAFFTCAFTRPTWQRFVVLLCAAILTTGCRTITNLLRTVEGLATSDPSSYHRVLSKRCWSLWRLGRALAGFIFSRWVPEGTIVLVGDDTVTKGKGKKVFGKGCHRDAVRSTHAFTAYRWGQKWVVLAVLVKFPFARRFWALPILAVLSRLEEANRASGRRHKTPGELMRQMLAVRLHWFHRHRARLTLVSRFCADANLYALLPPKGKTTVRRPRQKGHKLPKPEAVVQTAPGTAVGNGGSKWSRGTSTGTDRGQV